MWKCSCMVLRSLLQYHHPAQLVSKLCLTSKLCITMQQLTSFNNKSVLGQFWSIQKLSYYESVCQCLWWSVVNFMVPRIRYSTKYIFLYKQRIPIYMMTNFITTLLGSIFNVLLLGFSYGGREISNFDLTSIYIFPHYSNDKKFWNTL